VGKVMEAAEVLTVAGLAGAVLAGRSRPALAFSGAALLTASALTRFGVFEAGRASARDPKYTVGPQRERLRERAEASAASAPGAGGGASPAGDIGDRRGSGAHSARHPPRS
jgi:hypothetical protein